MVNLPEIKVNLPKIEKVQVSRVVLISGMLTFLYIIEFCLGIRNVYHAFSLWNSPYGSQNTRIVSWPLCVACLLVCATSSFTTNLISAMWEQKQLKEKGQEKSAIRFAFHIIVGGMIWRYVCLWFNDKKELQRKEAMLLTMSKFLFSQFYTVPMVIVSASLMENFHEIVYDLCAVGCISVTLLLTCIMFSWCKSEVDDLKKWNYETVDLVPLIFCQSSDDTQPTQNSLNSDVNKEPVNSKVEMMNDDNDVETAILRIIVLLQTLSFTFGRLLALGILLRLAGIYAVSIMFLQLLISVVYLKFQVPFLVSDSLPKWRQLCRLSFMSYILIFEWQLNRDPKSGYDFTSKIKHSMIYYIIATLESIFYFVTWAITESYMSNNYIDYLDSPKRIFVRNLIIVGIMSLVFSLTVYILLMFWQSRRLSKLLHSLQRSYLSSKLKMANSGSKKWMKRKTDPKPACNQTKIEISNPIPIDITTNISSINDEGSELEKHSSYRDLREPLDDEIELYVKKETETKSPKTSLENLNNDTEKFPVTKVESYYVQRVENSTFEEKSNDDKFEEIAREVKSSPTDSHTSSSTVIGLRKNKIVRRIGDKSNKAPESPSIKSESNTSSPAVISVSKNNIGDNLGDKRIENPNLKSDKKGSVADASANVAPSSVKLKMNAISETVNEGWNKFSSLSRKFTGAMQEQIQKRKEQFQNIRTSSGSDNSKRESSEKTSNTDSIDDIRSSCGSDNSKQQSSKKTSNIYSIDAIEDADSSCEQIASENSEDPESSEGYFMGDSRCHDAPINQYNQDIETDFAETETEEDESEQSKSASVVNLQEESDPDPEPVHCEGDEPCPCFVCRTTGDGQILRRRRSSSVPLPDRKTRPNLSSRVFPEECFIARFASTSNIVEMDARSEVRDGKTKERDISNIPKLYMKGSFQNLSVLSLENRIEHYV